MAIVQFEIPDGYTPVCLAIPDEDIPDTIATYEQIAGYNPTQHGDSEAVRIQMAKDGMGRYLNGPVVGYRAAIITANAEADGRKIMVL